MKKSKAISTALLLCACMISFSCFGGTAAAEEETQTAGETQAAEADSLYTHGLEVISLMSEMVHTEYPDLLTSSDDILSVIQGIFDDDFSAPTAVYALSLPGDALSSVEELNRLNDASDALKTYFMQKVLASLINRANGMGGAACLSAASICAAYSLFVDESADRDLIYLYTYEDAVPAAVIFTVGEDHAVSASGMFVLYEDFPCGSAEEIAEFFNYIPVEVSEIPAFS